VATVNEARTVPSVFRVHEDVANKPVGAEVKLEQLPGTPALKPAPVTTTDVPATPELGLT